MLEVKNLKKVYTGKGGVSVKALDGVSVVFPERGMVFLLGRSGSGKSTLLNVAGGLDKPDDGEIIVKGKSSKEFSSSDFDSYRNTFIGFVFQEYNILNEFTIEQNIALALQLQNKPNDKAAVAALLEKVDLAGYGKRKPNTLSGGQKQRVAIARALIKEPEIIMADEPTGALDSGTGKQVLDTLKKLSEEKLVIVVSHDRDFAEQYGDRIIEMKDGKVISDVSKVCYAPTTMLGTEKGADSESELEEITNVSMISEDTISIKKGEDLTDEEVRRIAEMLRKKGGEAIITADAHDLPGVKRACRINENGEKESFKETELVESREYDGSKTKFIKSRLPLGHAIKMGASGLKTKPIRLIFTILLSVAAFVLFGVLSTFMLYDPDYSISEALKEANYPSVRVNKYYTGTRNYYDVDPETGEKTLESSYDDLKEYTLFGESEVASRSKKGVSFAGIYYFSNRSDDGDVNLSLETGSGAISVNVNNKVSDYYCVSRASGYCDCGEEYLRQCGFTILAGRYPLNDQEVMLPEYLAELFVNTDDCEIARATDLVGKKIRLSGNAVNSQLSFIVVGIVKTGEIPSEFGPLRDSPQSLNREKKEAMQTRFYDYVGKGFFSLIFVHESFYDRFKEGISRNNNVYVPAINYNSIRIERSPVSFSEYDDPKNYSYSFFTEKTMADYAAIMKYYDLSGKEITNATLAANEVYVSLERYRDFIRDYLSFFTSSMDSTLRFDPESREELGLNWDSNTDYRALTKNGDKNSQKGLIAYVEKWYSDLAYKGWLYSAAGYMREHSWYYDEYDNYVCEYDADEAFTSAYYAIQSYVNSDKDVDPPTAADWDEIERVVLRDFKSKFPQYYYGLLLNTFQNVNARLGDQMMEEYRSKLLWQEIDEQEFSVIKGKIDQALAAIGKNASDDIKSFLTFNVNDLSSTLYYCGSGTSGTLKVVGYFDYGVDYPQAEYIVHSSFLATNARLSDGYYYSTWTEETVTGYVAPADAKYNALIAPTDNSFEQISAALAAGEYEAYSVDNSIGNELEYFLELIQELGEIFLYVGLGVGLLAAFLLLNFISVSIAAKRKDIGILRAVGARGSDVFKIFYAEAFLIAFICFVIASIGSFVLCLILNGTISETLNMKLLNFGPINIALIFGISIFVSVIATFFPVYFAARKSPVESIRAL